MNPLVNLISNSGKLTDLPDFKPGQTVILHQRIKEGDKQRLQAFEGMIIKVRQGKGINATITVRKIVDGVGVERMIPVHSPLIAKIEITKESQTRRSKLYYLRHKAGKAARMKTKLLEGQIFEPKRFVAEVAAATSEASPVAETQVAA